MLLKKESDRNFVTADTEAGNRETRERRDHNDSGGMCVSATYFFFRKLHHVKTVGEGYIRVYSSQIILT